MMIGILALQGNVQEHSANLARHGVLSRPVRRRHELEKIDGLILPGGESTAMRRLIESSGLKKEVGGLIAQGLPVWGTCAGVVLLAEGGVWPSIAVRVERNAYGSQLHSRVAMGGSSIARGAFPMVFIRAPRIASASQEVVVLAELDGDPVAVRYRNILLTTFHPELTLDSPFTAFFIEMAGGRPALSPPSPDA